MSKRNVFGIITILVFTIVITVLVTVSSFLSREDKGRNVVQEKDKKHVVGFCIDTTIIERWEKDRAIFEAKAKEAGFDTISYNAYEDEERQIEQIRSLIQQKVDAIVIIALDKDGLSEVVAEAKKAGIIVIAYDRLISNANVDAYISFDNEMVGEYMASYLYDAVPEGNYVIINGSPDDHNVAMLNNGFQKVLGPYIESGEITILEEVWAEMWREDEAYNTINRLLQEDKHIDGIIGANDRLSEAAISALAEYGLAGEVPIVGQDADISACQRIIEDIQLMTVYKPIKVLAQATVETLSKLLNNETVEVSGYINDGTYDVPYIKFDVIPVTKENMRQTIIADGFHKEEDVYRNVQHKKTE